MSEVIPAETNMRAALSRDRSAGSYPAAVPDCIVRPPRTGFNEVSEAMMNKCFAEEGSWRQYGVVGSPMYMANAARGDRERDTSKGGPHSEDVNVQVSKCLSHILRHLGAGAPLPDGFIALDSVMGATRNPHMTRTRVLDTVLRCARSREFGCRR